MDIATHALMGLACAYPIVPHAPLAASCFVLGSVAPDLDAFSRLFGKLAFLRWHQTYTHSLLAVVLGTAVLSLLLPFFLPLTGWDRWAPLAFGLGMLMHIGTDVSNTYGTAVLAPFSGRRFCTEWVFFIDAGTIVLTSLAIAGELLLPWPVWIAVGYLLTLAGYWLLRMYLRNRAAKLAPPATISLIPSAFDFWNFFGYALQGEQAHTFRLNSITGRIRDEQHQTIYDEQALEQLSVLPEFQMMRRLSPAYHVVSRDSDASVLTLCCRDLRVRNFGGLFGELEVCFDHNGLLHKKVFHV